MCGFRFRSSRAKVFLLSKRKKIVLYLSVRVFSTKVLTGDTIFTSPTGDGTRGSTRLQGKGSTFISQLFLTP